MTQTRQSAKNMWCLWHKQQALLNICCVCDTSNRFCWKSVVFVTQVTGSVLILQRFHAKKCMTLLICVWIQIKKTHLHSFAWPLHVLCVLWLCLFACRHRSYIFYLPSTGTRKQGKLVKPTLGHTIMIITNYIYKPPFLTRDIYEAPSLTRAHSALQVLTTYN